MSQALDLSGGDIGEEMRRIGRAARSAAQLLAIAESSVKERALAAAAEMIRARADAVKAANAQDLAFARNKGLGAAMIDRLMLDDTRIEAMARGLEAVAGLPDPIGQTIAEWDRPNGLRIARVRVPLGVIGIIYESRPNVTADAGGLCLKSGNAAILRGGSESFNSSTVIAECLRAGLSAAGLPEDVIQLVPTRDRAAVGAMLRMAEFIDIIVPRGGKSLIERVMKESRIPVIAHLEGNCHVYIHEQANPEMARTVTLNAKMRRTGICGAAESLLVDREVAEAQLPDLIEDLAKAGCTLRGDETARRIDPRVEPATEQDWSAEYLDAIISIRIVDGLDQAIEHVNRYGSHHTDAIITDDPAAAEEFLRRVDSSIVLHNASTQFADGGEFGMGAEIGIATSKLHARGPVGAEQLTSFKYVVRGTGQTRP